jgi:hypothetical protein
MIIQVEQQRAKITSIDQQVRPRISPDLVHWLFREASEVSQSDLASKRRRIFECELLTAT